MKEETREYLHSPKLYLGILIGAAIIALLGNAAITSGHIASLLVACLIGATVGTAIANPASWIGSIVVGAAVVVVSFLLSLIFGGALSFWLIVGLVLGALGGVIAHYIRTSHTMMNVFHSPRFVVGFTIISIIVLSAVFYPMFDTRDPMYSYGDMFLKPGTYFSIYDANISAFNSTTVHRVLKPDAEETRHENYLPESQLSVVERYLARKYAITNGYIVVSDYEYDADSKKYSPRDMNNFLATKLSAQQTIIGDADKTIADNQAKLEKASERARANIEKNIVNAEQRKANAIAAQAELQEKFNNGYFIMDSEAMRNWEEYTGINASNEYRSELLVLWGEEYDPVIAAASVDEIEEMLGITIEDENIKNGKTFFTSQNGFNFLVDDLKTFERIGRALTIDPNGKMSYTQVNSNSKIDPIELDVNLTDYTSVSEVANTVNFPLGTDNNGRDMLLLLITAAGKSLLIGLLAGSIATFLGLLVGLLAGYVGGKLDDILSFIMNIFTVIPGFVLIIIIYNMVDKSQRGIVMCGAIIGVTSWVWTARSVRSQVISLRNRDHVNLSKLSGHSLMRIILTDILPYIASYVVMAFILQVSSGILAEAQLSILGLGPSMNDGSTLGLMMNWAKLFGAYTSSNAWWAYFPVIGTIALISFSLNLMNTGLDQVFNPTLRD